MVANMNISLLGIPMDLGAGRRGVDMGPSALRNAHLSQRLRELGHEVKDYGDVNVVIPETLDKHAQSGFVFLEQIVQTSRDTVAKIQQLPKEDFTLTIGGDHSMSMATVTGNALRGQPEGKGRRMGLIWVDAHTDYNTPDSSPSGNIHGMPVAHLTGLGHPELTGLGGGWHMRPEDIVMIGIRSVDKRERELVQDAGIKVFTMRDIDQLGIARIFDETMERLSATESLHVSYDADALDPSICPGVGTPVPGGLTYREGHLLMELLCETGKVGSMDIVEVNPVLDTRNATAKVMVGMAASLLGQRIL